MPVSEFTKISEPQYVRVQVVLEHTSGLPEDRVVNDWSFVCQEAEAFEADIASSLETFYNSVGAYISSRFPRGNTGQMKAKFYDLSLAEPNPPFETLNLDFSTAAPAGHTNLPPEVACCVSFHAPIVSGQNPKRRRGRIYLGPLNTPASDTNDEYVPATIADLFRDAAQVFLDDSDASLIWQWAIFSPTNAGGWYLPGGSGPPNMGASVSPVSAGWVDNSWDTQRRRGVAPTARYDFS